MPSIFNTFGKTVYNYVNKKKIEEEKKKQYVMKK
jgi:hypothetical protein